MYQSDRTTPPPNSIIIGKITVTESDMSNYKTWHTTGNIQSNLEINLDITRHHAQQHNAASILVFITHLILEYLSYYHILYSG